MTTEVPEQKRGIGKEFRRQYELELIITSDTGSLIMTNISGLMQDANNRGHWLRAK